jgi:hypothetical protein
MRGRISIGSRYALLTTGPMDCRGNAQTVCVTRRIALRAQQHSQMLAWS